MKFCSPGPIFIHLGSLDIRWYGLLTAIAFLVVLNFMQFFLNLNKKKYQEKNLDYSLKSFTDDDLSNYAVVVLIASLVGARLWFVALNWDYFSSNPLEIPQIWHGGQSIQGGMLGSVLGTFLFYRKQFVDLLALMVSAVPLGQAIGRWGNFFNEEAFGSVTSLPWGLYISHTGKYHHPTFLYECLWNLLVFALMIYLNKKTKVSSLKIIAFYLLFYSTGRLVIESIRTDSLLIAGLPAASLISVLCIIVALIILFKDPLKNSTSSIFQP
jgi:phosphatidylglycerol:prolipoprotein diacylglycerol transferase